MAHIFTQENPKVSVGNANDVATTIPTPDQLGSFLVTTDGEGGEGTLYAAVIVDGTPAWVKVGEGGVAAFTVTQLQQLRPGNPGSGANQLNEPTIRIKTNKSGIASFRGGFFGGEDDQSPTFFNPLSGDYLHVGTDIVGGVGARPGAAVLREIQQPGSGGADVDIAFAPKLNDLSTFTLSMACANFALNALVLAQSKDYGLSFVLLAPVDGPYVGGTEVDREWIDTYGDQTVLMVIWSDSGLIALRTDVFGVNFTVISPPIIDSAGPFAWQWDAFWNNGGGAGQLRLQIDKLNTAGATPGQFWAYMGVGASLVQASPGVSGPVDTIFFYRSNDGGSTWVQSIVVNLPGVDMQGTFNDLSIAPDGSLWITFSDMTNVFVTHSTNHGVTWSTPQQVSTPSTTNFARLPKIIATDNGMAVLYSGTPSLTENGLWSMFFVQSNKAGTNWSAPVDVMGPTFAGVVRNDDGTNDRTVFDLFGMDVDASGWAHLVFGADGTGIFTRVTQNDPAGTPVGAVLITVRPLGVGLPAGTQIIFPGGSVATMTAPAVAGATSIAVEPLLVPIAFKESALTGFPSSFYAIQTSGRRLGRTNY